MKDEEYYPLPHVYGESEMRTSPNRDLRMRTKQFALRVIRMYLALPRQREEARIIGRQVLRSGTSVGAQYREAWRSKSDADFVSKIEGALQELDETQYWMELLMESEILPRHRLIPLHDEAEELIAILVTIVNRVKARSRAGGGARDPGGPR